MTLALIVPVCRFIALYQNEVKGSREYQRKLGVAKQKYLEDRHQQQAKGKREEKSSAQKGRSEGDLSADEATQRTLQKEIDEILARYGDTLAACDMCVCGVHSSAHCLSTRR
jgi:hypothetical protein